MMIKSELIEWLTWFLFFVAIFIGVQALISAMAYNTAFHFAAYNPVQWVLQAFYWICTLVMSAHWANVS